MSEPVLLVDPAVGTLEVYATEAEWLEARRRGIGASEAPAVLGLSPFQSAVEVWAGKLGLGEPRLELERMRWGKRLQRAIAEGYAEETGRTLVDPGPYTLVRSVARPWLHASPDYFLRAPDRPELVHGLGVLEVKNSSTWARADWLEEPPVAYQIQSQQQMEVTGARWGAVAALLGGQELVHADVTPHADAVAWLLEDLEKFWRLVETETPPPVLDGSESTTAALRRLYPKAEPVTVTLPPQALEWDRAITEGEATIKRLEARVETAKNYLRAALKDAERGVLEGGAGEWRHKLEQRKAYIREVPAWEGRVLRRVKPRGKD